MSSKIIAGLVVLFFTAFSSGAAHETGKKIYVSADQLVITQNGILAHIEGCKSVAGKTLSFDEEGMYIREWKGPCWIRDLWCRRCGGCGVLLCPMNCSCFD